MRCLFGHSWAYSPGKSPGLFSGKRRSACVRRICVKCCKQQEVAFFTRSHSLTEGRFFSGPVWQDGFTPKAEEGE